MALTVFLLGVSALAGEQMIELLEDNPLTESTEIKLFDEESQAGSSLMVGGKAHRVSPYASANFEQAQLVVLCSPKLDAEVIKAALAHCTVLDLHHHAETEEAPLLVAGINAERFALQPGSAYRSPEPTLLSTTLLLKALEPTQIQPLRVTANLICPASLHDQAGIQALATETAHLLNGREAPSKFLEASLAFNLLAYPQAEAAGAEMPVERLFAEGLPELVDEDLEVVVTAVQAPLFHGTAVTLVIETQNKADLDALVKAVDRHPRLRYTLAKSASTQSITGVDECLVSRLRLDQADDRVVKMTLLFDEQRLGRASNAVSLIASLTPRH